MSKGEFLRRSIVYLSIFISGGMLFDGSHPFIGGLLNGTAIILFSYLFDDHFSKR